MKCLGGSFQRVVLHSIALLRKVSVRWLCVVAETVTVILSSKNKSENPLDVCPFFFLRFSF